MKKESLNEVKRLQKIAGLLKEDLDLSDTPKFEPGLRLEPDPNWDRVEIEPEDEGLYGNEIVALYKLPQRVSDFLYDVYLSIERTPEGKYYVHYFENDTDEDMQTQYDTLQKAEEAAVSTMGEIIDSLEYDYDDTNRYDYL